eukprot:CAMPEP_0113955668 /NCGR_PEP_ID=MMETSP0011_2-20120614/1508_1 /TAXON_ID=101924 /ORGANISM="Rhodosorus marinus" /LENGTH=58 /DNA_ID=CAMNT_0000965477 /DNA_START=960 /DNA_END=1133 /DNA_ORIENTATION=+ /assembly_acc=CAM_ASM_000156
MNEELPHRAQDTRSVLGRIRSSMSYSGAPSRPSACDEQQAVLGLRPAPLQKVIKYLVT